MTLSDRWSEVDRLYHAALEHEPADRGSFLNEACAGDEALRTEVESLLRYQPAADEFLERPALQQAAERLAGEVSGSLGDPEIPGYTILKTLGEGGMGVVYLAEQQAPIRRAVALKLIKHGMDTRQVVARFEGERQALALMHHPHIAAVFDAGTSADGRPFFVMEYVDGVPITTYCDLHKLSTRARLELFKDVCAGVQHAHQKGVIHRDLKPSNVLVTDDDGRPVPKIIDFGIAKAIQPSMEARTTFTEQGTLVGTPEYMSPEQAALSPDIDTSTDVYSLGVLLYELLVGSLPFDPKVLRERGPDEMRRVIRESDPPKPSSRLTGEGTTASTVALARQTDAGRLARHLKGDLDWITLKALEKDRRHRYATASAFGADIQRFLADKPVDARPPSAAYRMRKFTRRYRTAVAAVAAVFVVLIAGLTVSIFEYLRAEEQRAKLAEQTVKLEQQTQRAEARTKELEDANRQLKIQQAITKGATAEATQARNVALTQSAQAEEERRKSEAAARIAEGATAQATRSKNDADNEAAKAITARKEAEYNAYANAIAAAESELHSNQAVAARERLLKVSNDLRGWEWQHLFFKSDPSLFTLASATPCARPGEAEGAPVTSSNNVIAVRNRGARIYLRRCNTLEAWDAPAYTHVTYQAEGPILAVSSAGAMLVVVRPTKPESHGPWSVQLVDPASHQAIGRAGPFDAQPICADISPDGRRVAIGLQPEIGFGAPLDDIFETWDLGTEHRLGLMPPLRPNSHDTRNANPTSCLVTFSPSGAQVATSGATVHVWNTVGGREILPVVPDSGQAGFVSQPIAWARDGARVAIGRSTGLVDLLHVGDGRSTEHLDGNGLISALPPMDDPRLSTPAHRRQAVLTLAFSEDGKQILTGTDLTMGVWDLEQRKLTHVLAGHAAEVTGVASIPGGGIVSADTSGKVKLWASSGFGAVTHLRGSWSHAGNLAVSADGSVAAVAQSDGGLFAWHLDDMRRTVMRAGSGEFSPTRIVVILALAFGRNASQLFAADHDDVGTVQTWATDTGLVAGQPMKLNERPEQGCERLPNGDPTLALFNNVDLMALSPDGRTLAFRQGRCVVVRDLAAQKTVITLREYPSDLKFLPDGALVVASYQWQAKPTGGPGRARVRIWDWRTDSVRANVPTPKASDYENETWRIATSADGNRIAVIGGHPTIVSIWDGGLTHELGKLPVPAETQKLAWSPDGKRIASTASDFTIRIWDAERLQSLLTLTDDDLHGGGLTFTLDGRLIAGRSSGGLTIWDTQRKVPPGRDP
jgi:serine/threonine protein kinase/WD40 repeat protein